MLRHRADLRTLAFVATFYALVAVGWVWHPQSLWLRVPLIFAICLFAFFCAVATHNTVHCPIFRSRTLNRLMQIALSLCYGHPVASYVPGHNLSHHRYLQTRRDIIRTNKMRWRWNLLNQLFFFHSVAGAITRDEVAFARAMWRRKSPWIRQFLLETVIWLGVMGLALGLDWEKTLQYVIIPHQYAAWGIVGINFVQHDGCDADSPWNHSRNFVGRFVNWWVFNNGFHGMHHMEPALHWSLLPKAHAEKLHPHIHPALEQRSLLVYLFRAYVWPGKRLTYDGKPVVLDPPGEDESWIPQPGSPEPVLEET